MNTQPFQLRADLLVRELFPPGVQLSISHSPAEMALWPEEELAARSMVPARRLSFAQGRSCARKSLQAMGLPAMAIPVGEQRAPVWPAGVNGAIAHCHQIAAAAVARREVSAGLGIDLENAGTLEPGVIELICTRAEQASLLQEGNPDHPRLYFAIKESIYKCLWPFVRRFIDFHEVELEIDLTSRRYLAHACSDSLDYHLVESIRGRFCETDGLVATSAYLPAMPVL